MEMAVISDELSDVTAFLSFRRIDNGQILIMDCLKNV